MTSHLTLERAQGRWPEILSRFGIDRKFLRNRHGPCPMCGGEDRFRFDDRNGSGSYFCNHCGASKGDGAGIRLLMKFRGWDFRTAVTEVDHVIGTDYVPPPRPAPPKEEASPWDELYREWQDTMP
jgi:putative DNA primase/helicase